ncbi:MAG: radical SAM family heme chaperone HemW [Clostridia bacterium]|nr:radical SAM family heme chaperone HemW [Clostridia bacterium]
MELYLHIPFCRSKCRYCDFTSWSGRENRMEDYADLVIAEARARADAVGSMAVETVFIGGGTPSTVPAETMQRLLDGVFRYFPPAGGAEFTGEANPGTLTKAWLDVMIGSGMNRLSLGMQAAQPELLRLLGRIHGMEDVHASVDMARAAGIRNLSLDLMFGIPDQTEALWRESLEEAVALEPEHLSCYGLIPEEGTPLKRSLDSGELSLPEEETERAMYDEAIRFLAFRGYAQYEISNFARPGYACRHNIGYWRRVPYLGLGISAASMLTTDGETALRQTNPHTWEGYEAVIRTGRGRGEETVTGEDARFETLMLGLRMNEGVSEAEYRRAFGEAITVRYGDRLESLRARGLLLHEKGAWRLTRRGMDIQNSILVELMD